MPKIEENVETLIMPIIEDLGYILYDVQYVKEAKGNVIYFSSKNKLDNGVIFDDAIRNGFEDVIIV